MSNDLRRYLLLTAIIAGAVILAVIIFVMLPSGGDNDATTTVTSLEEMQMDPPSDYIQQLTNVIYNHPDPYVKERAIFTLTEIALRKEDNEKITPLLTDIALHKQDANLQSAAYANLDLIKSVVPEAPQTFMDVSVQGSLGPGRNVTVTVNLTSLKQPSRTIVGIPNLPEGLEIQPPQIVDVTLVPGTPSFIPFTVRVVSPGTYTIPVYSLISYNRVESQQMKKHITLRVTATGGEIISTE